MTSRNDLNYERLLKRSKYNRIICQELDTYQAGHYPDFTDCLLNIQNLLLEETERHAVEIDKLAKEMQSVKIFQDIKKYLEKHRITHISHHAEEIVADEIDRIFLIERAYEGMVNTYHKIAVYQQRSLLSWLELEH